MRCIVCMSALTLTSVNPAVSNDITLVREFNESVDAALKDFRGPEAVRFPIGRTRHGTLIWCLAEPEALNYRSQKQRVLIVGGLDGSKSSIKAVLNFASVAESGTSDAAFACVPIANPDGWATGRGGRNLSGGQVDSGYPPAETFYNSATDVESQFLWRFVGWFAPDHFIEVQDASAPEWQKVRRGEIPADKAWPADSLAHAASSRSVAGIATAFASRHVASGSANGERVPAEHRPLAKAYSTAGRPKVDFNERSPLRQAVLRRLDRTPVEVAQQLARHYGGHLDRVMYQPALALVARLRLGELTGNNAHRQAVERIVRDYVRGTKPTLGEKASGSQFSGHLVFAELARISENARYIDLVTSAADFGFNENSHLREAMPAHNEMSDAVFMACPILTCAGRLTEDDRYFEMAGRHLRFMQNLCLRSDGIYRHSPLCEAAWGRGNGFPALGLALSLSDLDAVSEKSEVAKSVRGLMQESLEKHLLSLLEHQDVTGMWHQVIDDPGSYRELTSTCMITFAMVRGIRSRWWDKSEFAASGRRAWEAVKVRIGEDGTLFDVCTGTGKQKTLWDYRDRTAILGKDERGGAMALMLAVEMAAWDADVKGRDSSRPESGR